MAGTGALFFSLFCLAPCYAYWQARHIALFLGIPPLLTLMLFGLRSKGRLILPLCAFFAAFIALGPHWNPIPLAAAEANAVRTLSQMQARLEADKINNSERGFASDLPAIPTKFPVQRFYRFDYLPDRSSEGTIQSFRIAATLLPRARSCGCIRNFLITSDGNVRYTMENRPANTDDAIVDH
jgi:hypothetical protein